MRLVTSLALLLFTACEISHAEPPTIQPRVSPTNPVTDQVRIDMPLRTLAVPLTAPVLLDLRAGDWDDAADALLAMDVEALVGEQKGNWAFVTAWALVRDDRAREAVPLLRFIQGIDGLPHDDVALISAEILRADERPIEALAEVEGVDAASPRYGRAAVVRAELLRQLGRTAEAYALYETLVERPDPALGNPEALFALARRAGTGNPAGYPHLRRLWSQYPASKATSDSAGMLREFSGSEYAATWQEVGARAESLMWRSDFAGAEALTATKVSAVTGNGFDACRFIYVQGRSQYRQNELTNSIATFADHGDNCVDEGYEYGAKILYLKGTAQFRKRQYSSSATTFLRLAERYTESTLADDGLLHAGIALQEAGQLDQARETWLRGLDAFPEGDTVPEASFRVAFSYYLAGQPEQARDVARVLGALPLSGSAVQVAAGRYWHARWLIYPDVEHPNIAVDDPMILAQAVAEWVQLCEELPRNFYAIQAYARLVELAPEQAARLATRPADFAEPDLTQPWTVRRELAEDPHLIAGVALARVGLINEARADWGNITVEGLEPDERAWLTELRIATGDWLMAHDEMRKWFRSHPADTLASDAPEVIRVGYPDRYWAEVQTAADGDGYPARLFHGIVREESNFNRRIRSHAGARGLSQLMPATAREVAGWLGTTVTMEQLNDPATNLRIGSRYYDALYDQLDGSPYLQCVGYNAGGGRARQWKGEWGNIPTDEYVERIPFKETREYVKRVMGTWQVYNYQFDTGNPAFPDLSEYNHQVMPR